jgi:NodT family efflux transporter outer membrane factor (OMF) lipoprotein
MRNQPILIAALPLLACCALGPKIPAPDTRLPAAYEAPASPTAPVDAGAVLDRWWAAYDDPQLASLVDEALTTAPDARSARARLDEALATRSEALDAFNPQGDIEASGTQTDTHEIAGPPPFPIGNGQTISLTNAGITHNWGANFNVSWEIDLFGRRAATRKKANADLAAARFDYEASRASLAANVADSLFEARGLAIQLDDAQATERIERDLAEIARKKADHGLGSAADADQAASQAAQSQAQATDLDGQLQAARRTLLVLVGRGIDPLADLPIPAAAGQPPKVPATVPGALLVRRPDLREDYAKLVSALGQLKLNELALFPKFDLEPGVGISSATELGTAITTNFWSIGAAMAQPVLDMPRLKSEIRVQGARANEALITYEQAVQTAYGESENALAQLAADERRIAVLTAGEAKARSAYDAAQKRYAAGIDDLSSALSAEQTWRTARTALTGAQVQALRRSVQAFKALGGGWAPTALASLDNRPSPGGRP